MKLKKTLATLAISTLSLGGALAFSTTVNAEPAPRSDSVTPRIVGGETADYSAVPYLTKVVGENGFICTSSAISDTWVITARHCVGGELSVQFGSASLNGGTEVPVKNVSTWVGGDIALLELERPISTSYGTLGGSDPTAGDIGNIYGWGRETPAGPPASQLKTAKVEITGFDTDYYDGPAIAHKGINGQAWKGDSGGPLVVDGKIVGIASTSGSGGSNPNAASYYTSVAQAANWIKSISGVGVS